MIEDQAHSLKSTLQDYHLPARYSVERAIGEGGMGLVLAAEDSLLGRKVAIKLIRPGPDQDESMKERFLRETKVLASLDHINIVRILSSGISGDGALYYVMELIEGQSLGAKLEEEKVLTLDRFHQIFRQILSGLEHAHQHQITHRDIKPSNILLSLNEGQLIVKIIDFGIARVSEESVHNAKTLTRTDALIGSLDYMSPEQCRGRNIDHRSDIYSVGCLMYRCLCGKLPLQGAGGMETMYKHMQELPEALESMTPNKKRKALGRLVDRCLKKDQSDRPQSAEICRKELDAIFSAGLSIEDTFVGRHKIASEKRKMALTVPLAVIGLLLLTGVIFGLDRQSKLNSGNSGSDRRESKIKSQERKCDIARERVRKTRDTQMRYDRSKELSKELKYLAELQMPPQGSGEKEKRAAAALAVPIFTEAIQCCHDRESTVDMYMKRAECRRICGELNKAEADYKEAEPYATGMSDPHRWKYMMLLKSWSYFYIQVGNWSAAEKVIDKLTTGWPRYGGSIENGSEPLGLTLSGFALSLAEIKVDDQRNRIIQVRIINKLARAILSHTSELNNMKVDMSGTTMHKIRGALVNCRTRILPGLAKEQESVSLVKETEELFSMLESAGS